MFLLLKVSASRPGLYFIKLFSCSGFYWTFSYHKNANLLDCLSPKTDTIFKVYIIIKIISSFV